MRPQLLKITSEPTISFSARKDLKPYANNNWHYHPEIELIHIIKGEGTLFAGDSSIRFKDGDVVLLGSQLPHYWRFDDIYTDVNPVPSSIELLQFCEDFWGHDFLKLPENKAIVRLFEKAKRGIIIPESISSLAKKTLTNLIASKDAERLYFLIKLLSILCQIKSPNYISLSTNFKFESSENERINAIYNYSLNHFKQKIYLKDVAAVANLATHSFCRYFKKRTKKSYSTFIIELRVGYACKLLSEKRLSIKEICFESGFNSFTNFNKQFKLFKGLPPNEYRKKMNFE